MAAVPADRIARPRRVGTAALAVAGFLTLVVGLGGRLSPAWGYGLFALATLCLAAGCAAFSVLLFTRAGGTRSLVAVGKQLLLAGGIAYVLAVCALAGYYVRETYEGRMEWPWLVFGPCIVFALVVLDVGLYRKLVKRNLATWQRFRQFIRREDAEPEAMRRTFLDDVVLHRTLYHTSRVRWLRHTLIFWGFMWMFGAELIAVFLREGFPAFGWRDVWHEPGHPVRLAFDFMFDVTGLMILVGCIIALAWRFAVRGEPERKYADTPTTLFLLFVVASGFIVEGARIAMGAPTAANAASFVGLAFAAPMQGSTVIAGSYASLWVTHVIGACAFIAYVPLKRMVHTCATPIGRLMYSQKALLAAKKRGVIGAMLLRHGGLNTSWTTAPRGPHRDGG